ncbi:acetylxylan esterase [Paenibacillus mucilaginosus]|uniref:Acetyl xylan esterase n=1 Tax=Paenibacillus mucilaginosus (strain KNP414) TaxID=1036673 RepID=F8FEE5_PAEMK|nr:acetylxylan esterase [Paenibacillus mucilaginosus]AEI44544.1 Acetyl xylan esterase [Paenibacillus mucilaginosus KNP414]MCG7218119.1 acetylxylan esterase [Paenibacillus mucilaginosus]WDM26127.1 acetylxylan esterase [Paenibacillus mucilaginosus]
MPLLDMPLGQLQTYQGRNPRPDDFDAYWEKALEEMRNVDPQVELVPSSFTVPFAECFDLYFTGVRGARIHAKYIRPKGVDTPHPAVLHFHGYTGSSGDWQDKLSYAALGFAYASLDVRGQGGLSEDTGGVKGTTHNGHFIRGLDDEPQNLLFRHIFLDTAQLASIVMGFPEVDAGRVGATGWSQGGALTMACAALEPRIKKAAPVYPFLSDYRRVWEMDLAKDAYAELRTYFRHFDPQHQREEEIFTKLGYIDIQHLAPRIKADTLAGVGLMDPICPPSTQFAAFNKMTAPLKLEIFPDFGHEGLPGMNDKIYQFLKEL